MDCMVMVSSWEQQCCGDEFGFGTEVHWDVETYDDDWAGSLLGPEWAGRVAYRESHHGQSDGELTGGVRDIRVVTCTMRPAPDVDGLPGMVLTPVPGSGRLRHVEVVDEWEPEPRDDEADWAFVGWLVTLGDAHFAPDAHTAV